MASKIKKNDFEINNERQAFLLKTIKTQEIELKKLRKLEKENSTVNTRFLDPWSTSRKIFKPEVDPGLLRIIEPFFPFFCVEVLHAELRF